MTKYNLLIDIGNTNTKWLLVEENKLLHDVSITLETPVKFYSNFSLNQTKNFAIMLDEIDNLKYCGIKNISKIAISNVNNQEYLDILLNIFKNAGIESECIKICKTSYKYANVFNNYKQPDKLGIDRWLSIIATDYLYPKEVNIVISCGTATTIDFIINSQFIGGHIIAGYNLMLQSMLNNSELIKKQNLNFSYTANVNIEDRIKMMTYGDDTYSCLISGALIAQCGYIEKAISNFLTNKDILKYNCIMHGKSASNLIPYISTAYKHIENLIFLGIAKVLHD